MFRLLDYRRFVDGALYLSRHARYLPQVRCLPLSSIRPYPCRIWLNHRAPWHCANALGVRISTYLLARLVNSLDHVTEGRMGWNCVTDAVMAPLKTMAETFKQFPHDERYDIADEFADVVTRLWEAWDDAVVLGRDAPMFTDGAKVHPIHHEGKYFRCRGAHQYAALSTRTRTYLSGWWLATRTAFASRWADTIITEGGGGVEK